MHRAPLSAEAVPAGLRHAMRGKAVTRSSSTPTGPAKAIPVPAAGARSCASGEHEKELFGGERAHHEQPHGAHRGHPRAGVAQARTATSTLYTDSQYVKNGIETLDPRLEAQRLEDRRPASR